MINSAEGHFFSARSTVDVKPDTSMDFLDHLIYLYNEHPGQLDLAADPNRKKIDLKLEEKKLLSEMIDMIGKLAQELGAEVPIDERKGPVRQHVLPVKFLFDPSMGSAFIQSEWNKYGQEYSSHEAIFNVLKLIKQIPLWESSPGRASLIAKFIRALAHELYHFRVARAFPATNLKTIKANAALAAGQPEAYEHDRGERAAELYAYQQLMKRTQEEFEPDAQQRLANYELAQEVKDSLDSRQPPAKLEPQVAPEHAPDPKADLRRRRPPTWLQRQVLLGLRHVPGLRPILLGIRRVLR